MALCEDSDCSCPYCQEKPTDVEELKERINLELHSTMSITESNPNGPDRQFCGFCGAAAYDVKGVPRTIDHEEGCLGKLLEKFALED